MRYYTNPPQTFDRTIANWDTASTISEKADYSVGTVWGAKGIDYFLLDLVRGRWEFPELRRQVQSLTERWEVNATIIEDTETGRALAQDLRRTKALASILHKPRLDKEARFLAQSSLFKAGQVHVPQDVPWLGEWTSELIGFPNKAHDDQVDSTSQALHYLTGGSYKGFEMPKRVQRPEPSRPKGQSFRRPTSL